MVAVRARAQGQNFMRDPEAGPWTSAVVKSSEHAREQVDDFIRQKRRRFDKTGRRPAFALHAI
jgi:CelD/BcsL family acetyltransferase involved in cellulose biosynthesis